MNSLMKGRGAAPTLAAAFTAAALAIAGCGGGEGDSEAISETVAVVVMAEDPERMCSELITPELVNEIYGDKERCIEVGQPDPDDGADPDEVVVSEIEKDGEAATVTVTERGGETDGATGTVDLAKNGDAWQISAIGIDYLRSTLESGFESGEFTEEDGPLYDAAFRECLNEELQSLDDDEFRRLAYDGMAERDMAEPFENAYAACSPSSGDAVIRRLFEQGIRESVTSGDNGDPVSPAVANCVIAEIRTTVSDQEIANVVSQQQKGAEPAPEVVGKVSEALVRCEQQVG